MLVIVTRKGHRSRIIKVALILQTETPGSADIEHIQDRGGGFLVTDDVAAADAGRFVHGTEGQHLTQDAVIGIEICPIIAADEEIVDFRIGICDRAEGIIICLPQITLAVRQRQVVLGSDEDLLRMPVHLQLVHGAHMGEERNKADTRKHHDDRHDDQHLGQRKAFSIPTFFHHLSHPNIVSQISRTASRRKSFLLMN